MFIKDLLIKNFKQIVTNQKKFVIRVDPSNKDEELDLTGTKISTLSTFSRKVCQKSWPQISDKVLMYC